MTTYLMDPESIAAAINASVEACMEGTITLQQHSEANLAMWARATELGLHDQVDKILQAHSLAEMNEAVEATLARTPHRRAWIRILRPVTVPYRIEEYASQPWPLKPGVIGNVYGHTSGVELYPHRDGTVTVILRAAFVETWERIPKDAMELGPMVD